MSGRAAVKMRRARRGAPVITGTFANTDAVAAKNA
jgi:hypothetical protein